jgi:hypothetical protein
MPFFAQKYLTRYTHETFSEEYMNFETHYLSHCRVIPLQSFGSHIRPQPHGLGLIISQCCIVVFKLQHISSKVGIGNVSVFMYDTSVCCYANERASVLSRYAALQMLRPSPSSNCGLLKCRRHNNCGKTLCRLGIPGVML